MMTRKKVIGVDGGWMWIEGGVRMEGSAGDVMYPTYANHPSFFRPESSFEWHGHTLIIPSMEPAWDALECRFNLITPPVMKTVPHCHVNLVQLSLECSSLVMWRTHAE
jgi:hypothetical protein